MGEDEPSVEAAERFPDAPTYKRMRETEIEGDGMDGVDAIRDIN